MNEYNIYNEIKEMCIMIGLQATSSKFSHVEIYLTLKDIRVVENS